jgi:hypothetical protein
MWERDIETLRGSRPLIINSLGGVHLWDGVEIPQDYKTQIKLGLLALSGDESESPEWVAGRASPNWVTGN